MTANLDASRAILKVRYPGGTLPKAMYKRFKYMSTVKKRTDFTGEYRVIALQNENPQGSSASFPQALDSLMQGVYNRFNVTRVSHYGVVRITGEALKAASGDEGALVDLWKNEMDGASRVELMNNEIYAFGSGNGLLGRISSGSGTATVTLTLPTDAAKFALYMKVQVVTSASAAGYNGVLQGGGNTARIIGIDRANGTLTLSGNWSTLIPGTSDGDYLVRAGDAATAGVPSVIVGIPGWIPGGATPGTLYGLNRNSDPVRLGGQVYAATGVPIEEAVQRAAALVNQQGGDAPTRLWCHPLDSASLKISLGSKTVFQRGTTQSNVDAKVGFKNVEIEGDDATITLMTSPFITRGEAYLIDDDSFTFDSLGPAPGLLDADNNDMLRVAGADQYEARFGQYAAHYTNNPLSGVRFTGFGA